MFNLKYKFSVPTGDLNLDAIADAFAIAIYSGKIFVDDGKSPPTLHTTVDASSIRRSAEVDTYINTGSLRDNTLKCRFKLSKRTAIVYAVFSLAVAIGFFGMMFSKNNPSAGKDLSFLLISAAAIVVVWAFLFLIYLVEVKLRVAKISKILNSKGVRDSGK